MMTSQLATGSVRWAALGLLALAAWGRADDIDDMLQVDQGTAQEVAAMEEPAEVVAESGGASDLAARLRARELELQRAHSEIARLQRALVDQDTEHQMEMQRSYYNMGCVYKASKQFARAETEFLKVLAINPSDAATHYNLAILYDDDLQDTLKAREHYKKFLELAPDDADAEQVKEWLAELVKK